MANIRVALRGLRALAALLYSVGPFDVASLPSSRLLSLRWLYSPVTSWSFAQPKLIR